MKDLSSLLPSFLHDLKHAIKGDLILDRSYRLLTTLAF